MKTEKTLVLLKPDLVKRNLIGAVIDIYEKNKLTITNIKMTVPTTDIAREHYIEHQDKDFFPDLINYITSGPVVALIIEGENAISKVRELHGNTDPNTAADGTIRKLYALNKQQNSVHSSDSLQSATKEINIWFN